MFIQNSEVNKFNEKSHNTSQGSKYKIKAQDSVIEANSSELKNKIMQQIPNDLQKPKPLLSTIKTASNTTTKYFDLKSQTSENEAVLAVCFSPEKHVTLHQLQQKKSPVKIVGAQLSSSKRFSSSTKEYTISKKFKIPFKESFNNRFYTISQVLDTNPYETVDIKVKISTKSENKQAIVHRERTRYKLDCIVVDETNSVKLVLWEETIDKVKAGKSYHRKL